MVMETSLLLLRPTSSSNVRLSPLTKTVLPESKRPLLKLKRASSATWINLGA